MGGGHLEQGVGQIACADVQVQAAAVGDCQALFEIAPIKVLQNAFDQLYVDDILLDNQKASAVSHRVNISLICFENLHWTLRPL